MQYNTFMMELWNLNFNDDRWNYILMSFWEILEEVKRNKWLVRSFVTYIT